MRKLLVSLTLGALLLTLGLGRAGEKGDPQAVIAKAIKAVGGEAAIKKHDAVTWDEKGIYYGMGDGLPYTGKYAVQWPDQFRMEIEGVFAIVLTKEKGWMKANGMTNELPADAFQRQRKAHLAGWVTTLLPLKDKSFTLTLLPDAEVAEKPAAVVQASRKDIPDVKLFFDKQSGLLVKAEYLVYSDEEKKEVTQTVLYQNYKEVAGMQNATRVVLLRDGKRFVEADISNLQAPGKLDAKVFAAP